MKCLVLKQVEISTLVVLSRVDLPTLEMNVLFPRHKFVSIPLCCLPQVTIM